MSEHKKARLDPEGTATGKTEIRGVAGGVTHEPMTIGCTLGQEGTPVEHVDLETKKRTPLAAGLGVYSVVEVSNGREWRMYSVDGPFIGTQESALALVSEMRTRHPDRVYETRPVTEIDR